MFRSYDKRTNNGRVLWLPRDITYCCAISYHLYNFISLCNSLPLCNSLLVFKYFRFKVLLYISIFTWYMTYNFCWIYIEYIIVNGIWCATFNFCWIYIVYIIVKAIEESMLTLSCTKGINYFLYFTPVTHWRHPFHRDPQWW